MKNAHSSPPCLSALMSMNGIRTMRKLPSMVGFLLLLLLCAVGSIAADAYVGRCDIVFEGDSTLHAFKGDITNVAIVVLCETNASGAGFISTRIEINPRQLTTHHAKRDANMYKMFREDTHPLLLAVVTNAPLADARLVPASFPSVPGVMPVQLTLGGVTGVVSATTTNPKERTDGYEFDLQATVSLKAYKLAPPSVLFGVISVADTVKVRAHVVVQRQPQKP